ncbi:MAG: hypothetical protein NUV77_07125 [Thermoguttaceae bacterium]|nr:hypothetical protein [Thermoguttaceae bacterium]
MRSPWFVLVLAMIPCPALAAETPIDVGSRWELLVDDYLIARLDGGARQVLHHPTPREVVLTNDAPWEGSGCNYYSIFQDGDRYRMYYHGWQLTIVPGRLIVPHQLVTCYAESRDGIHWIKPELGLVEFGGSKKNNIVLDTGKLGPLDIDAGHIALFRDENPRCPPEARYKAIVLVRKPHGLAPLASPDGLHWSPMADKPVITKGAFDSQNLAFWDPVRNEYRAYVRYFAAGRRDILTATSKDFIHWTEPVPLEYPGAPADQLYTNQIKPYYRAPQLLMGFPTRYVERPWSPSMEALPEREHRKLRASAEPRFGTALTEGLFMTSRDGRRFHRWGEAFLRPGPERPGTWQYGQQYIAWHVVETDAFEGHGRELSLYATEAYWVGQSSKLRRYTLRIDGFVSIQAPWTGGELVTKPLVFRGNKLLLNFSTSAAGSIRVEIQDAEGRPLPGFALDDCPEVFGDSLDRPVTWKQGSDLAKLAGGPIRLRFVLRDADLYALRFAE